MLPKTKLNDELFEAILKLETVEECYKLFDDLCTIKEVESMAQRINAAKLLLQNNTYEEVITKTSISSVTLSRISKCIKYGSGGYKAVLDCDDKENIK